MSWKTRRSDFLFSSPIHFVLRRSLIINRPDWRDFFLPVETEKQTRWISMLANWTTCCSRLESTTSERSSINFDLKWTKKRAKTNPPAQVQINRPIWCPWGRPSSTKFVEISWSFLFIFSSEAGRRRQCEETRRWRWRSDRRGDECLQDVLRRK